MRPIVAKTSDTHPIHMACAAAWPGGARSAASPNARPPVAATTAHQRWRGCQTTRSRALVRCRSSARLASASLGSSPAWPRRSRIPRTRNRPGDHSRIRPLRIEPDAGRPACQIHLARLHARNRLRRLLDMRDAARAIHPFDVERRGTTGVQAVACDRHG